MKRYFYIASIVGLVTSCTNDNTEGFLPKNKEDITLEQATMQRDSTALETGGQGGSTPIKPPKPQ
ncbi:hypothetical protein [Flavobacterium difficile]|uniref:Lipoprotein n=1 Tax=Flavobacterium difficile TaxID=2709659 RepID=A0ABX0I313_9FLAO|nr:hypothetical protein [Flavobacterium difficile]NHM01575.1 hypothetical protein [Flavobacterium difficile]